MYTKNQLKEQLKNMGLAGNETILVHSSMKSIGAVDGGADTVLDALIEYFEDGLSFSNSYMEKCQCRQSSI